MHLHSQAPGRAHSLRSMALCTSVFFITFRQPYQIIQINRIDSHYIYCSYFPFVIELGWLSVGHHRQHSELARAHTANGIECEPGSRDFAPCCTQCAQNPKGFRLFFNFTPFLKYDTHCGMHSCTRTHRTAPCHNRIVHCVLYK